MPIRQRFEQLERLELLERLEPSGLKSYLEPGTLNFERVFLLLLTGAYCWCLF